MRPLLLRVLCLLLLPLLARADFALRDGDTLVFLGDSITAARGYTKIVENYTLMRFPDRKVRFWNAGEGGDTAERCLKRLEKDVFAKGATVVTVAFGINDIGWGTKADAEHRELHLQSLRAIVNECSKRNVRVYLCSAAITAEDPEKAELGFLQKLGDDDLALARELGVGAIDLQRGMREIQRKVLEANRNVQDETKRDRLHVQDGIHLSELGQLAMGYAMLKGLGAPEDVSSATLDAATGTVQQATGCRVDQVQKTSDGLTFTRLDEGLPLNLGVLSALQYRYVPVPDGINRYLLKINNLPPGDYILTANGRGLGKETSEQLARGVNLAHMTADGWHPGGPWDAQSDVIKEMVDARDKLWMGNRMREQYLASQPEAEALARTNAALDREITELMRRVAKPYPYRFELRRAGK